MSLIDTIAIPLLPLVLGVALLARSRRVAGRLRRVFLIAGLGSVGLTVLTFTTMFVMGLRSRDPLSTMSNGELLADARAGRPALHVLADRLAGNDLSHEEMRMLADVCFARLGTSDSDGLTRVVIPIVLLDLRDRGVLANSDLEPRLAAAMQLEFVCAEQSAAGQPVPIAVTMAWPWFMRPISASVELTSVRVVGRETSRTLGLSSGQLRRGSALASAVSLSTSTDLWDASPLALRFGHAARIEGTLPALRPGETELMVDVRIILARAAGAGAAQPEVLSDHVRTLTAAVSMLLADQKSPITLVDDDAMRPSIRREEDRRAVDGWCIKHGALWCSMSPVLGKLSFAVRNPPVAVLYDVQLRVDGATIPAGVIWQRAGTEHRWQFSAALPSTQPPVTAVLRLVPAAAKAEQYPIAGPVLHVPIEIPLRIESVR